MNEREGKIQCRVQQPRGLGALNNMLLIEESRAVSVTSNKLLYVCVRCERAVVFSRVGAIPPDIW